MTFSITRDFLNRQQLDLDSKLIQPSQQVVAQLNAQIRALYIDIREQLLAFPADIAAAAKQVYEQPLPTMSVWYDQAVKSSQEFYALFQNEMVPSVTVTYQQVVADVTDAGLQAIQYGNTFWQDPEAQVTALYEQLSTLLNSGLNVTEATLANLYDAMGDLLGLLLEQPGNTVQALYYNTMSALLDLYFSIVTTLLDFI